MEQSNSTIGIAKNFLILGLFFLVSTLLFGLLGAIEYAFPGIFRDHFSFVKIRPLHVSSAIFWIIITAVGCLLYFLKIHNQSPLKNEKLIRYLFYILGTTFITILITYIFGYFGGREYWEFDPILAIPITLGWLLLIYIFLTNFKTLRNQPVYIWMWFTGVLFFLFTYLESNMWLIPSVRNHLVKDMLIQWKSYGSLVGSWNLLIYGSSIFLMDKISGDTKYSYSPIAFWIYFLGLTNLMFNWGHHIYTLPTQPYIRHIAYLISMTELLLFGRIIYQWKSSLDTAKKHFHVESYRFLVAADVWVFLSLGLAIAMSVPALNIYMHGTHIIVSHTMGTTIGINTMLLLAYISYIFKEKQIGKVAVQKGFWLMNSSLFVFWIVLMLAGVVKAYWQFTKPNFAYREMISHLSPYFYAFLIAGVFLIIGLLMIVLPLIKRGLKSN
jgi:nitric oxide reductase subunit B